MKFTLTINCNGSAFDPEDEAVGKPPQVEVARILHFYADRIGAVGGVEAGDYWPMLDLNGNTIGRAEFAEDELGDD